MAKRLTEEDIRRIFREAAEWKQKHSKVSDETKRVIDLLWPLEVPYRPGRDRSRNTPLASEVDWTPFIQKVIDTYWEVVEEECNE